MDDKVIYTSANMTDIRKIILGALGLVLLIGLVVYQFTGSLKSYLISLNWHRLLEAFIALVSACLGSRVQLVIMNRGVRIRTIFKQRTNALLAWDEIDKVIVYRTWDNQAISKVLIIGRHPLSLIPAFDVSRGLKQVKGEPAPGREIIRVPGRLPDIHQVIACFQELIPDKVFEEACATAQVP